MVKYNNFRNVGPLKDIWFGITAVLTQLVIELTTCSYLFSSTHIYYP